MIKVGLIGIGGMGGNHFECYKNIENAEVVAVADVREAMASEKISGTSTKLYKSIDELLEKEDLDMVDICTPSYMHREMSIKCLGRGLNVLCEKPMSLNSDDTAEIIKAAEKSGKIFMTAHVVRFMKPYVYLKNVIESNKLGRLLRLDLKRISEIPYWSWENWMLDTEKSGGTPIDLSIHDIDFVQYVLGMPKEVGAVYRKLNNNNDFIVSELVYDQDGIVEYKNEKLYNCGAEIKIDKPESGKDTGINISSDNAYEAEIRYFISCIENSESPKLVTPDSSHNSIKLIERILNSATVL
ncbi:MAG: Gfo/Idh/MocA family oxidoreductase [Clostridiales bacterium]|nr:Gfo/Idh/MocA family oxidoreductase [Clostridiales bacterium]